MTLTFLGIDTGGTFTDFVCIGASGLHVHKVLSTPSAPQEAIVSGIKEMGLISEMVNGSLLIVHGTTVATNAILEGKGVKTVYIANRGLKDVLKIGRQTRGNLYDLTPNQPGILFEDELSLEVSARVDARGNEISDFEEHELARLKTQVDNLNPESIAINLLFSFLSSKHEEQLESLFRDDYFVSRSSLVLPEYREYERGITTWLNAWIGPIIKGYMTSLVREVQPSQVSIMQSSGLSIAAPLAADRAVNLLLSGPVGGLSAAQHIGAAIDQSRIITFDMGGTSTDVALIEDRYKLTNAGSVDIYPVSVPMADIHTIGAGGGSIALIDTGGLLQVGPQSAGANPGPACYEQGGTKATVTDANLVLGRLQSDARLAGQLALNLDAAIAAIQSIAAKLDCSIQDAALGIIRLANEHMGQALRVISVQRGFDPRQFTLISFGGAGGLHLCDLAESLEMLNAVVPVHAGVFSALGMLTTKPGREMVRTLQRLLYDVGDIKLGQLFDDIEQQALAELALEGVGKTNQRRSLDLRYQGQSYAITVDYDGDLATSEALFHEKHTSQYSHQMARPIEILNCRLHIEADRDEISLPVWQGTGNPKQGTTILFGYERPVQVWQRSGLSVAAQLQGPCLVIEKHATTYIKPEWHATVDEIGNLLLKRTGY